jgi:hypothetical protein
MNLHRLACVALITLALGAIVGCDGAKEKLVGKWRFILRDNGATYFGAPGEYVPRTIVFSENVAVVYSQSGDVAKDPRTGTYLWTTPGKQIMVTMDGQAHTFDIEFSEANGDDWLEIRNSGNPETFTYGRAGSRFAAP